MSEKRTPRKVVQIAVSAHPAGDHLFALTDDGVVWMLKGPDGALFWVEIPAPPDRLMEVEAVHAHPRARSG